MPSVDNKGNPDPASLLAFLWTRTAKTASLEVNRAPSEVSPANFWGRYSMVYKKHREIEYSYVSM